MQDRERNSIEAAVVQNLLEGREDSPLIRRIRQNNQLLKHNFRYCHARQFSCALDGCTHIFELMLVPGQIIYPKYCEEHRSNYRRELFRRQQLRQSRG